jgi:hypothetical protein
MANGGDPVLLIWPHHQPRPRMTPRATCGASVGGLFSFRAALTFSIKGCLVIGLDAGGGIGHNRVYLRDAVPGELELGIADSKRALGGDKGSLKLKARGTLKRHVSAVATDLRNRNRYRLIFVILTRPRALILCWIDGLESVPRRDQALRT